MGMHAWRLTHGPAGDQPSDGLKIPATRYWDADAAAREVRTLLSLAPKATTRRQPVAVLLERHGWHLLRFWFGARGLQHRRVRCLCRRRWTPDCPQFVIAARVSLAEVNGALMQTEHGISCISLRRPES